MILVGMVEGTDATAKQAGSKAGVWGCECIEFELPMTIRNCLRLRNPTAARNSSS